ncbi:MAG: amidohydrolase [Candidatus Lokiarchaeota archaeon]|jgi:aminobenzoyl-glutamate utilization protein B|nr:amidohydrolase [Candidatus Lokiarchaeota archaeon]
MFRQAIKSVKANQDLLIDVSDQIWEFAELGLEEFKSSKLLTKTLNEAGFSVKSDVADMPTAFYADYGKGKPVIGILGEYDALPGLSQKAQPFKEALNDGAPGHGCGHNLLGVASLGAVLSVKEAIDLGDVNGTIRFYGCPAEEIFNSKGYMIREGLFEDVDIAMTWHPGNFNMLNLMSSQAMNSVKFKFHGRSAHAAGDPQNGRSALDAVELMNVGANYMREHMISDARLHYVITHGGDVPNVVPAEAEVHYFVRAPERHQVEELYARLINVAKGATLMTETTMEIDFISGMYNTMYTKVVSDVISNSMKIVGPPRFNKDDMVFANELQKSIPKSSIEGYYRMIPPDMKEMATAIFSQPLNKIIVPPLGKGKVMPGSTDVAEVSWKLPLGEFGTACEVMGSPGHSWQNAATSGMSIGHKGMLTAAKILAVSALDFMKNPDLVEKAQKEHSQVHKDKPYESPLPEGLKPPHHRLKH